MEKFNLDLPVYYFNGTNPLTVRDCLESVQIFGGIGSGKTSGSGASLAKAFLRAGMGGLVLCAKKDEMDTWREYMRETGRLDSLIEFDASGKFRFPFLQYEVNREGEGAGNTHNLTRLFLEVHEAIDRSKGGTGDPFWSSSLKVLCRNAIDLVVIARGTVSVPLLYEVVRSAPQSSEQRDSEAWRSSSLCFQLLMEGHARQLDKWTQMDFDTAADYWLEEFPNISPKTRSGIVAMFSVTADLFMRKPFRMLFSEPPEDWQQVIFPELTHQGIVMVMNLPVKEFSDAGRAAQIVYKTIWQQAAERRDLKTHPKPVFLFVDESQNFVTDYDHHFLATSRSSRVCVVYLTQNLPNYFAELGNKDRVHSLVGNMATKIFHANSDPETNQYAAEVIGRSWQRRAGESNSIGGQSFSLGMSQQESFELDTPPQWYTRLPKGGPDNDYQVGAIVFQNGRTWDNGKTFLVSLFKQQK